MSRQSWLLRKTYKNLEGYLSSYGDYIIKVARNTIKKKAPGGSGRLSRSLQYRLGFKKSQYLIKFNSNRYGAFVERGVQGLGGIVRKGSAGPKKNYAGNRTYLDVDGKRKRTKFRFRYPNPSKKLVSALIPWITKNGISISPGQTVQGIAYAMAYGIIRKGVPGISFYAQPISATKNLFIKKLSENYAKDLEKGIVYHGFKVKLT